MAENVPQDATLKNLVKTVEDMQEDVRICKEKTSTLTWNNQNWLAVKQTLETTEKRMKEYDAQLAAIKGLVMTLQGQFMQFQQQRATELQHFVNFGPTAPNEEDNS